LGSGTRITAEEPHVFNLRLKMGVEFAGVPAKAVLTAQRHYISISGATSWKERYEDADRGFVGRCLKAVVVMEKSHMDLDQKPLGKRTLMEKIKQRKGVVLAMALGTLFLYGAADFWHEAHTHIGPGVVTYGGDKNDGRSGDDEVTVVASQREYRKNCKRNALIGLICGAGLLLPSVRYWRDLDRMEAGKPPLGHYY